MRPRLLLVDNLDSFTHNLAQAFEVLGAEVSVVRELPALADPTHLVLSPGPGRPEAAEVSRQALEHWKRKIPTLGVCLGHQVIALAYGARVSRAQAPVHGKTSRIRHDGGGLFAGLPSPFEAARYHSLTVEEASLPSELLPCAWSEDGTLMAFRHATLPLWGVQFHPESFLSPEGGRLLANFLKGPTPTRA